MPHLKDLFKLYDLIQNGDPSSVSQLLSHNFIDLNVILPCKGISVLHLAVGIEPLENSKLYTKLILKNGGDPNFCNYDGITPVHIAAIWGRLDNLKLLIGFGGDPSQPDFDGLTAFDYAVKEQQWEIYDYLHNVEDEIDDDIDSDCAYTFNLGKILVTTDHMVAEYDDKTTENHDCTLPTIRKSEAVREWCDKTATMNKLYPTILSESLLSVNNLNQWREIKDSFLNKNITLDISEDILTNDTNTDTDLTFRTCTSHGRSLGKEISGIRPLEMTVDRSTLCSCCQENNSKIRQSIYNQFSLPGSPNSLTHRNYNTKSNLKSCKNKKNCLEKSKNSASKVVDLNEALNVMQNDTNEWLSNCDKSKMSNIRQSSASSGIGTNCSGGSIVIGNVQEEYKYEDKQEDVVLIEKRLLVSPIVLPVEEMAELDKEQTIISVASSLPPAVHYDDAVLRAELIRRGFSPGPIQDSTRTLYLKKLQAIKKNPIIVHNKGKTYSVELERSLRTNDWMNDLSSYIELENKARLDFANPTKRWREGTAKTSFTYLLLDPRLTDNLPAKASHQNPHRSWPTFINSIFYIGKGKRSRPYSHLYQALTLWKNNLTSSRDQKIQLILDIWSDKTGVVCLHVFQNVIPAEAYTYEAAMIDVLGLSNLRNLKSGNYYGAVSSWPMKDRRKLGLYLLYKAMLIFLSEGERQLRPDDID